MCCSNRNYIVPIIGLFIMIIVAFMGIDVQSADLPRLYMFFALGAVMFIAGYIGVSIKSLK